MLSAQFGGGSILNVRAVIVEFTGSSLIRTCLLILCIYLFQLNFRHEKTPETLIVTRALKKVCFSQAKDILFSCMSKNQG